jgi:hypothetical protein
LCCSSGHLHRECSEKTNTESTPSCCNCTLTEGEKPQRASYRGYDHAKGELQRRRAQRAPKGPSGRTFFSKINSPEQSYAAALCLDKQHQQPKAPQTGEKCMTPRAAISATTGISENRSVSTGSQFVKQCHCSSSDHNRAQWSCVTRRLNNGHYKNGI